MLTDEQFIDHVRAELHAGLEVLKPSQQLLDTLDAPADANGRSPHGSVELTGGRDRRGWRVRARALGAAVPVLAAVIVAVAVAAVALTSFRHHHSSTAVSPTGPRIVAKNGKIALTLLTTVVVKGHLPLRVGLVFVNPDGSGRRYVAAYPCPPSFEGGCGVTAFAWSPDGTRLAYLAGVIRRTFANSVTLYLVGADGRHPRRLAACGGCDGVSWSPDGSQIAISRYTGGAYPKGTWNVWVVDTTTGALRRVTNCLSSSVCYASGFASGGGPLWSPDGRAILFSLTGKGPNWSLDTVSPDGSHLTKIATLSGNADPQWSPDGRQIAFEKNGGIYTVNADGTGLRLLVARGGGPSWSPDGTRLIYSTLQPGEGGGRTQLWVINADGSQNRLLYRAACCLARIWSPDGKQIAFLPDHGRTDVINANGTDLHHIGPNTIGPNFGYQSLAWQPIR